MNENNKLNIEVGARATMRGPFGSFEKFLIPISKKIPHLPEGWIREIAHYAPAAAFTNGAIVLYGVLSLNGVDILNTPSVLVTGLRGVILSSTIIFGVVGGFFAIFSAGYLAEGKKKGWDYLFYSVTSGAVSLFLSSILLDGGIGGIFDMIIGVYILFEIRNMYR